MKIDNNSIKLIDIDKLYIGLNEKMVAINPNDFDEIINNAIVKKDKPSKLNIQSDIDDLKEEINIFSEYLNIIKANQKNDYNSLDKRIDNQLLPIDDLKNDIKTLFDDIEDIKKRYGI